MREFLEALKLEIETNVRGTYCIVDDNFGYDWLRVYVSPYYTYLLCTIRSTDSKLHIAYTPESEKGNYYMLDIADPKFSPKIIIDEMVLRTSKLEFAVRPI